ncbi:AlbA family DNA-binding domain-containing protein [Nocardia nova]
MTKAPAPATATWPPETEKDLQLAADNGLLEETHHLDLKAELKAGDGGNREIAKDIASFAFDGGVIVIGIAENNGRPTLKPIPLAGLSERIEQVGLMKVSDPVQIRTKEIQVDSDRNGYLIVLIPPSARAPHMVDGKYYRRGDKTNVILSNVEVLQYHQFRLAAQRKAVDITSNIIDNSPVWEPRLGLVAIAAVPTGAWGDMLAGLASSSTWKTEARNLFASALSSRQKEYVPTPADALNPVRRPNGIGLPYGLNQGRKPDGSGAVGRVVECFIGEDGHIEFLSERAFDFPNNQAIKYVFETLITGSAIYVASLAGKVGAQASYHGGWEFAIRITDLRDSRSWTLINHPFDRGAIYTSNEYAKAAAASTAELLEHPEYVAGDLTFPLLRSLDCDAHEAWDDMRRAASD